VVEAAGALLLLDLGVDELLAGVTVGGECHFSSEIAVFYCRYSVIAFKTILW